MNYHYFGYRYYVVYTEIEWYNRFLSDFMCQNPPAPPLILSNAQYIIFNGSNNTKRTPGLHMRLHLRIIVKKENVGPPKPDLTNEET
jgi:hypothetical protein